MKKLTFILILMMLCALPLLAQGNLPGGFTHIIEVDRFPFWGKSYLTITDINRVFFKEDGESVGRNTTFEYPDEYKKNTKCHLWIGELILEVDGVSAAGWTKEQFYKKVDGRQDAIHLKIRSKSDTAIFDYETKILPLYVLPDGIQEFDNKLALYGSENADEKRAKHNKKYNISCNERYDTDFDFFYVNTYDFLITSNDPLLDKSILEKLFVPSMRRDENNPDIIFTIARNADESINSTYIPPTSRTINEGSKTRAQYNYITKQNDYITTQKNRTIHEGGYTQETKTIDLFLELAALDAKRINDPKMTHPPIVWQSTMKRHVSNPVADFDSEEELQTFASWANFPFGIKYNPSATIYAPLGISYSKEDPTIITNVKAGSRAQQACLKIGDKLLKAETPDSKYVNKDIKKAIKNSGWESIMQRDNYTYNIEIMRDGNKMKLTLNPLSKEITRLYWKK